MPTTAAKMASKGYRYWWRLSTKQQQRVRDLIGRDPMGVHIFAVRKALVALGTPEGEAVHEEVTIAGIKTSDLPPTEHKQGHAMLRVADPYIGR